MIPHHTHLVQKMSQRGWEKEHLDHAQQVMQNAHESKTAFHHFWDTAIFWILFILLVGGNIGALFAISPLFTIFPNTLIYIIIVILGLCFGFLFEHILADIDHTFEGHHHIFVKVFMPYLGIVGGVLVLFLANEQIPNVFFIQRNPVLMGVYYAIAFVVPFLIMRRLRSV